MPRYSINDEYFLWLYAIVNGQKDYSKLASYFHGIPFRWTIENDSNRLLDGYALREKFLQDSHIRYSDTEKESLLYHSVSFFEVVMVLCDRMEFQLDDLESPSKHHIWFEELLGNIQLDIYVGDFRMTRRDQEAIDCIINMVLDRTYDSYGNGSLFPIIRPNHGDVRTVELWYQLENYLEERYPV